VKQASCLFLTVFLGLSLIVLYQEIGLKTQFLDKLKIAIVGIAIDPDAETVKIYRSAGEPEIFQNGDVLTIPELFPGWELPVFELWPPIFTEEETQ
jgi:Uma2 family endonuclease